MQKKVTYGKIIYNVTTRKDLIMKKSWLNGKTVIISGASGGLGFNVAKYLIENYGCKIIGIARNEEKMKKNIATLGDNASSFSYYLFDVSERKNWEKFAEELKEKGIIPDVLINNAGFMHRFTKFENISDEEIDEIVKTNFLSVIYSTKSLLPLIKQSKTPAVINVASAAGFSGVVGESMYCATKGAVKQFTETIMQDYHKKIYVAGIYPGFIKTDILNRMPENAQKEKIVGNMMMPVLKATKRICKRISRKRKRIVIGFDGHYISISSRLMPKVAPSLVRNTLKISKLELFKELFED